MSILRVSVLLGVLGAMMLTAGCTPQKAKKSSSPIPPDASVFAEGIGRLSYRTAMDANVFVLDSNTSKVIFKGQASADQLIVVDPQASVVQIDDQATEIPLMKTRHVYRMYLQKREPQQQQQ